jgi:hypothetical protein
VSDRTDPLSAALSCVRRLSDEGLDQLAHAIAEERERRHKDRMERARWRGTRLFVGTGRLRAKTCLVDPPAGGPLSGFSGYYPTRCGKNGYGVSAEPAVTCPECIAAGAEEAIRGSLGGAP